VRSSLYALFPSIGACLAAAVVATALLRAHPVRMRRTLAALVVLPLVLVPVYRARNVRWVNLADLSTAAMRELSRAAARSPETTRIVLIDRPDERFNLDATFGALFSDAVVLVLGERFTGEILPSDHDGDRRDLAGSAVFVLRDGRLVQEL
jgi:hypothetical protein